MPFKIIFSDIDGTLLNADRELSACTIETIKKLNKKIPFILISSRMPAAMIHLQKQLGIENLPIICYNGGLVLVDGETISSTEIPAQIIEKLCMFNSSDKCHLSLYHHDEWYVPEDDFWAQREMNNTKVKPEVMSNLQVLESWKPMNKGAHKIMAMGEGQQINKIENYLSENHKNELHLYRSKPTYLEIAPKSISKLTAIELLLENKYNFQLSQSLAFGDNFNDMEMLQGVGMGIAVGNAKTEVMEIAHMVAEPGKEDGVAKSIEKLFKL